MKEAYYFSHDSNSRNDPKLITLCETHGLIGYACFFILIEMLREQSDFKISKKLEPSIFNEWQRYSIAIGMPEGTEIEAMSGHKARIDCCSILTDMVALGLVSDDGEHYFSPSLMNRMEAYKSMQIKRSEAGRRGAESRYGKRIASAWQSHSDPIAVKERKGKEKKEEDSSESKTSFGSKPEETPILVFKTNGNTKEWPLTQSLVETLQKAFPGLDIQGACRRAWGWCEANPQRRKTARGMGKFLFSWMGRENDKGKMGNKPKESIVL